MKFFRILLAPLDFIMKYFKALVFLLVLFLIFAPSGESSSKVANLARIDLNGPILRSDTFLEKLALLESNENIKGILLVVDSPGGAIAPSVEISEAIKRVAAKKPVVAYAQGSMASGSYLSSIWASYIVANKGSLIGSIGVIINGANVEELLNKIGIKSQSLKAGIYKEAGTFARAWTKDEESMLKGLVDEQYYMFVSEVATARGLNLSDEKYFAQGRVFSANNALKLRLVDSVGSIYDAEIALMKLANIQNAIWLKKDKIDLYLEKLIGENISLGIERGIYSIFGALKGQ
ncbi:MULTISPECIES: signal peptide peptidase SppA [Helicobacter]|uniref:Signal peptide peptidase SppA n=1 Tax=Helicobacter ibis TaxID=2962633 RepID=A0ABT4VDI7_9HELI|nr:MULTISPECIES: signal peptide peptidase SppA [Helicobacter]MDA3966621.1 signal peptide peptidase SppA [Helicobacter sp. WB40]MDA3968764.1 signal peptide peptidase SppA [Helicobacter ibis]